MSQQRQTKVLRIGIIQDGKIVQERLIKAGDPVTVGDSPKNTFVLPKSGLPSSFTLFKPSGKGYILHFTEKMKGKISSGGAVIALQKASEDPAVSKKDGVAQLPLTEQDRGKIQIDGVTVLFQFVPPPPAKAVKPIQQLDFRPRLLQEDDPVFIGFLGVWTALGLVLALWVWQTEPQELKLEDANLERYVKLVKPPETPQPQPEEPAPAEESPTKASEKAEENKGPKTEAEVAKSQEDLKNKVLNNSKLLLKLIGTQGESDNGMVANLWSDEEQGLQNIDDALKTSAGATANAADATRMGKAGGNGAADVGDIGSIGGGNGGNVAVAVTVKPKVSTGTGSVAASGDENQIKSTVGKYSGQLQYCYEKQLKVTPSLEGRIEVGWSVSAGAVTGMPYIRENTTGDAALADCVMKKIRHWTFPADVEGDMSWPFLFQQKK